MPALKALARRLLMLYVKRYDNVSYVKEKWRYIWQATITNEIRSLIR